MFRLLFLFSVLFFSVSHGEELCVADLKSQRTPMGYACKDPATLTVDDFVYTKLGSPGNAAMARNNASTVAAFLPQFPALNGLGVGMIRADIAPGWFFHLHSYPDATEFFFVESADAVTAGFIASNIAYIKQLKKGEAMVIPKGLLHFVVNTGTQIATLITCYTNPNPAIEIVAPPLFGNDIPSSSLLEKTTSFDHAQIKKLKAAFGGTN